MDESEFRKMLGDASKELLDEFAKEFGRPMTEEQEIFTMLPPTVSDQIMLKVMVDIIREADLNDKLDEGVTEAIRENRAILMPMALLISAANERGVEFEVVGVRKPRPKQDGDDEAVHTGLYL